MTPSSTPQPTTEFSVEQDKAIGKLGLWMKAGSLLLVVTALTVVALGVAEFMKGNTGAGLIRILESGTTLVMGLILLTAADSFRFLASTKEHGRAHLLAAARDLTAYVRVLFGLGCFLAALLAIAWIAR